MILRGRRMGAMLAALSALFLTVPVAAAAAATTGTVAVSSAGSRAPLGQYASTLTFAVSEIAPALVTSTGASTARIAGTMTNTGQEELTDVVARIQRGQALTSPTALQEEIADPSQPAVSWTAFTPLLDAMSPGATEPFSIDGALFGELKGSLALTEPGVYPIMVNVNAQFASGPSNGARVGEFHALLTVASVPASAVTEATGTTSSTTTPSATSSPPATNSSDPNSPATERTTPPEVADPIRVSQPLNMMMPLVDRPHRDPTGAFFDDDLAALIGTGGRLDRVLAAAESSTLPPQSRTVAVDPELLQELELMSQGYTVGPNVFDLAGADSPTTTSPATSVTTLPTATNPSSTTGGPQSTDDAPGTDSSVTTADSARGTAPDSSPPTTPDPSTDQTAPGSTSTTGGATTSATATPTTNTTPTAGPVPGPTAVAGTGTPAATDFLRRLRVLAATTPVLVLPYSDIDAVAAVRNGHADQVTAAVTEGRQLAAQILGSGAQLVTDLSWPINGFVDQKTLTLLRSTGMSSAVLDLSGVADAGDARVARIATDSGDVSAALSSSSVPTGAPALNVFTALTAQNYFSAVLTPTVLAPARSWQPDDQATADMTTLITELGVAGIVTGAGIVGLSGQSGTATATVDYPDRARTQELPADVFDRVDGLQKLLTDTQAAFTPIGEVIPGDRSTTAPDDLFDDVVSGLARQYAGGFRIDPAAGQRSGNAVQGVLDTVQAGAFINPPTTKTILTSSSSPLLVTITNNLPYTVHVRISVDAGDATRAGMTITDVGIQTVQAQSSLPVTIAAETTKPGPLSLRVQLTTPDGARWGPEQTLQLTSTAYGAFTITMIVIAAIVVVLTSAVRIYKRYRQRSERIEAGLQ